MKFLVKLANFTMAVSLEPFDLFWCFNFWERAPNVYFHSGITTCPPDRYNRHNTAVAASFGQHCPYPIIFMVLFYFPLFVVGHGRHPGRLAYWWNTERKSEGLHIRCSCQSAFLLGGWPRLLSYSARTIPWRHGSIHRGRLPRIMSDSQTRYM